MCADRELSAAHVKAGAPSLQALCKVVRRSAHGCERPRLRPVVQPRRHQRDRPFGEEHGCHHPGEPVTPPTAFRASPVDACQAALTCARSRGKDRDMFVASDNLFSSGAELSEFPVLGYKQGQAFYFEEDILSHSSACFLPHWYASATLACLLPSIPCMKPFIPRPWCLAVRCKFELG